jgi:hypothetical protein
MNGTTEVAEVLVNLCARGPKIRDVGFLTGGGTAAIDRRGERLREEVADPSSHSRPNLSVPC